MPVFDGHNDVLLRLFMKYRHEGCDRFLQGDGKGHLDLPRMFEGGFAGGLFAIFVPPLPGDSPAMTQMSGSNGYSLELPPPIEQSYAVDWFMHSASLLGRIERQSSQRLQICTTVEDIRGCIENERIAAVMHIEGAEALDAELGNLEILYRCGLRSVGPVWSRSTAFGHGVPFQFPGSPDTGPGLTSAGIKLVHALNDMNMMIDVSHLNEKGFWDIARLSRAPLVASHSNAHALCPSTRNLTDEQLAAIRDSDGLVGVNLATCFIRADGQMRADTPIDDLVAHIDYLLTHLGETRVGIGSDFDGAVVPASIGDVSGLDALRQALSSRGYDDALINRICYENWLSVLDRTWAT